MCGPSDKEGGNDMSQRRYLKPSWLISRVANPLLTRFGIVPTLRVRGRRTGQWRSVPVNVLELDGERYLVAPRGETDWVRNLRAAGGGQLQYGRQRPEPFTATEVADEEKPPIIEAYLQRWGGQVRSQFEALPDPADHPVFIIERSQQR
jgi:deazaflavin-dependent oxidoreductase (nitroreductase family)